MAVDSKKEIGRRGEYYARKHLRAKGMRLVAANWRCRAGEIDIVLLDHSELVFVEVKTRLESPQAVLHLFDNITYAKRRKLRSLAEIFLRYYADKLHFRGTPLQGVRIDVVGVVLREKDQSLLSLSHLVGVV